MLKSADSEFRREDQTCSRQGRKTNLKVGELSGDGGGIWHGMGLQ